MPIVNNIFITKNKKDPNAEPYFVSSNESCEHILKLLSKFFPDEYSKLKGHVIYHTNNLGPSIGRSGDFAVFAALWNAIHNKPAKQVIFTGKITDDGTFYPVGGVEQKNKCAQALKKPIVVGPHNFVALKGIDNLNAERSEALMNIKLLEKLHLSKKLDQLILNILSQYNLNKDVLLVESLPDLVTLMYNHPNLDHAALEKINGYKPFVERHRRVLQAIMAFCATTGGVYMYSHQDN
jgi:hypothetical protein